MTINPVKRLTRNLRIVLVLSCIGSGLGLTNTLTMGVCYHQFASMKEPFVQAMPELKVSFELMLAVPQVCYLLMAVLYALSLTGVILMMRLRRNGWHAYTLAQLLLLLVPVLFMGRTAFNIGDLMLTLLFAGFYFFTLRDIDRAKDYLKNQPTNDENTPGNPEE